MLGVAPKTHVLIDLDHSAVVGSKGVQQAPKLTGMSGGGIFVVPGLREPGIVALPQFVGITTEQRKSKKLLLGTRIAVLLQAIERYRNATEAQLCRLPSRTSGWITDTNWFFRLSTATFGNTLAGR